MFEVSNDTDPMIFLKLFHPKVISNFSLRHCPNFTNLLVNSVYSATKGIFFLGPRIWELVPSKITEKSQRLSNLL